MRIFRHFGGSCGTTLRVFVWCVLVVAASGVLLLRVVWASSPAVTVQSVISSDGYVNAAEDDAGVAVAIEVDEWATISAAFSDGTDTVTKVGVMSGAVHVEQLSDSIAVFSFANDDNFGFSVARDGDTLVVGAVGDNGISGTNEGAVYIIKDSDADGDFADTVAQDFSVIDGSTAGITLTDNGFFGNAVAIDGDTLAIGLATHDSSKGKVYLIDDGGDDWGSIQASDITTIQSGTAGISLDASDRFGTSIALDDGILVIGASGDDSGGSNRGAIYIISDGADNSFATLSAFDVLKFSNVSSSTVFPFADDDGFGTSVALDNGVIAIGATGDDTGGTNKGAVYLIDDGTDNNFSTLSATDVTTIDGSTAGVSLANEDYFGTSVALTDGMLAIGASGDDTGGSGKGAVYLIRDGGDGWGSIVASDVTSIDENFSGISLENGDSFGAGVAIDGGSLAVGVPYRDTGGTNKGVVYMFDPKFEALLSSGDFEQDSTPTAGDSKLADGTITITVTATDVAGMTGTGAGSFVYDPTAPTFSAVRYAGSLSVVDAVVSERVYGSVDADNFSISGAGNPTVSSVLGLGSSKDAADTAFTLSLSKALTTGSALLSYQQDTDTTKRVRDIAGNVLASFALTNILDILDGTVGAVPVGAAQSKTIPVSGVTSGAAAKYKLLTSSSCTAATYAAGSGEQTVTLSSGSGLVVLNAESTNGKYLCLQVTKAGGYTKYARSGLIAGIDRTGPTITLTPVSGGYVNAAEDDSAVVVSAVVSDDTASANFTISDGTDALPTKTATIGGTLREKLHTIVGNLTIPSGADFGTAVSRDGDILAVGVPGNDPNNKGAVYIITDHDSDGDFSDAGTTERRVGSLVNGVSLSNNDKFGQSVYLSGDTLVVGASGSSSHRGAAYIIIDTDNDGDWTDGASGAVQKIDASMSQAALSTGDYFGSAVYLRDDLLIVGAGGDGTGGSNRGSVYIFTDNDKDGIFNESDTTVREVNNSHAGITLGDDDYFGNALALHENMLVVGAPNNDTGGSNRGAVFLLTDHDTDGDWTDSNTTVAKIHTTLRDGAGTYTIPDGEKIGSSLALFGGKLYIGSRASNASRGAMYILIDADNDADWTDSGTALTKLHESLGAYSLDSGDEYGSSVWVDDEVIMVGAIKDDDGATNAGAVYMYDHAARVAIATGEFEKDITPTGGDGKLAAGTVTVAIAATDVVGNSGSGSGSFVYDPGVPTLTIDAVSGGQVNASEDDTGVTVSGTTTNADNGSDVALVFTNGSSTVTVSGIAVSSNAWTTTLSLANLTALGEGTIVVSGIVTDSAGNTATAARSFVYDATIPSVVYTITHTDGMSDGTNTYLNKDDTVSVHSVFDEAITAAPVVQLKNGATNLGGAITAVAAAEPLTVVYSNTLSTGDSGGTQDPLDFGEPSIGSGIIRDTLGSGYVYKTTRAFDSLYIGASGNFGTGVAFIARTHSSKPTAATVANAGTQLWHADSHGASNTAYGGKRLTNVARDTYFWFYPSTTRTMTNRDIIVIRDIDANDIVYYDSGGQTGTDSGSVTDPFDFGSVSSVEGVEREVLGSGYVYKTTEAFRRLSIATKAVFGSAGTYYARYAPTKPTAANLTTHGTQMWSRSIPVGNHILSGADILSDVPANTFVWFYPSVAMQVSNRDFELKGMNKMYPYIATYTVGAADMVASGDLKYDITSSLQDAVGNMIATPVTTIANYSIDTTIPTVSSVKFEGTTVTIALSEDVWAAAKPDTGDFTVTGGGAPAISNIHELSNTIASASTSFIVNLASALNGSATLAYTQNSVSNAKRVKDRAGNLLASFSAVAITAFSPATVSGAPSGTSGTTTLQVDVGGTDITHYRHYLIAGNSCSANVFVENHISSDALVGDADGIAATATHFYVVHYDGANTDKAYAYTHKGVRDSNADITLASTNRKSVGAVADSTHLYVLENDFSNAEYGVYVYNLSTGARDTAKEFALDPNNDGASGIAKTDTHFYVLEDGEGSVYAYTRSGRRVSEYDITSLQNTRGTGITSNSTHLYVLSRRYVYVYALSDRSHVKTIDITKNGILQSSDTVGGLIVLGNYFYIPNATRNSLVYAVSPVYGAATAVATDITDSITAIPDGSVSLCVIGRSGDGAWQRIPTRASWVKETVKPTITAVAYKDAATGGNDISAISSADEIYSVISFSEPLAETAGDGSAARPKIVYRIGSSGTETQYDIIATGSLASGDCKANSDNSVYTCWYDGVGSEDGNFKSYVTAYTDAAGNAGSAQTYATLTGSVTMSPVLTATITVPGGSARSKDIAVSNVTSGAAATYKLITNADCTSTNYSAGAGSGDTLTVSNEGTGSVRVSSENDNNKYLCLRLTKAGSSTVYVGSAKITGIDWTAPTIGAGTVDFAAADDTGSSDSDNITKNTTGLTFSGTLTGDAGTGEYVQLYDWTTKLDDATDTVFTGTPARNWSIDIPLAEGTYNMRAVVVDEAGNRSTFETPMRVVVDTTAPTVTTAVVGTDLFRRVKAADTETAGESVWKYKLIDGTDSCDADEMASGLSDYTENTEQRVIGAASNGKKVCFSSTDTAGNTAYSATAALSVSAENLTRVWNITDGSAINDDAMDVTHDFSAAIYSDSSCTTALTNTTAGNLMKLGTTAGGNDVGKSVSYDATDFTIAIDPTNTLADDTYYASISDAWYYSSGGCNRGTASNISFIVNTVPPTMGIDAVASDNIVNSTEDDGVVSISGTSSSLLTGTTVTVTLDDADADTNADLTKTGTTDSSGDWSVSLTSAEVLTLEEGSITVSAQAAGAGDAVATATKTITYDKTAPTISSAGYNGTSVALVLSESVYGTAAKNDFALTVGGASSTISSLSLASAVGSASTVVMLTTSTAIAAGSSVTLAYSPGGSRFVKDIAGNSLAAVSSKSVSDATKSVSVSAVSADDYINDAEDEGAVLIAGTSTHLASGTSVTVAIDDADADSNADYSFTVTTNSSGVWTTASTHLTSARMKTLEEGALTITASAADAVSGTRTVTYDKTAPTLTIAAVSGGYVNASEDDSAVTISGTTTGADTGSDVDLTFTNGANTVTKNNITVSSNAWSTTLTTANFTTLTTGTISISGTVDDTAGNTATATQSFVYDTASPSKPTSLDLAATDDSGSSNTDNITKNTTGLTIIGCAEANSTVELFKDTAAFSTPATDTADGATGCTSPAKQFSVSVSLDAQVSAYSITAKATDLAGNTSAASVALSITVDTTAPTITTTVSGTNDNRTVSAADNDTGTTMKYKIVTGGASCNASAMSSSTAYTEGNDVIIAAAHNGKKVCFSSTDTAGNIGYQATATLTIASALTATVSAVPSGSAKSKDISISAVTSGAAVKYNLITDSACSATNYGSGGTALTLTNNAATVTVTDESDNTKYLCFKLTKTNFSAVYVGSAQITGIDDTAPTVTSPTITTSNSNTSYAKQGDTITVSIDFSEEIDEDNTAVKYQVGSGTEKTFSYTTGTVTSGKCKETTDSTDVYSCKYTVASGDAGLFKAKVSAFKDTAGNSGTAQSYNGTGITVDTSTPSKPTGLDLASDDDTGSSNTDNLTKNTAGLTITGCAEANGTVELFKGGSSFSTPATDTADGASGCVSPAKQFSISVPLAESGTAYDITAKVTDAAGNTSAASVKVSITVDTTAPTITTAVAGTDDNRTVSATDNDAGSTMRSKIITSSTSCNASAMSSSIAYTEGADLTIAVTHNGKKVCFSSTDSAGNIAYQATGILSAASALTAAVSAVPSGSATSKDISISSVTSGASVKYKLIAKATCSAVNYGSGGTALTLTDGAATVTITNESDNTKYLCFKITKTNFSDAYFGSAQITGIDDTAPTVASPTITTSNSNTSYAKQGDTITVSIDFSEEIDEDNTTIKYQVGAGTETSFTYTTGTVTSGKCKETTDNTDVYSCKYTVASGDTGLFKAKVSAFKDTAGNSGTAQTYNATGITVDTSTPSKPTGLDLAATDDTGSSNTDNLTKNTTGLTITGCAEANSEVELFKDNAAFSAPATDTADTTHSSCTGTKRFSVSVSLAESGTAYGITAKATDAAGNISVASVALSITVDTTAPTITTTVSGTNDNRTVSATDNDTGTTMKYKIITASSSCNASSMSSSIAYTEGNDLTIAVTHNGKKVCFSSTDSAGNVAYQATGTLSTASALTATVSAVPSGSARSKNITISSVTSGASVKYKLITNSVCNATNYGSGGTSLTLTNNAATVTVTNESDNTKYLCFKLTKANFSDAFVGSAQITGIDDTAPTVASPTIATSNSNTSYAKQGDTITVSLDFSEEIDEDNTTIKYQVGSGTERTFSYTTGTVTSGKCKETTDSTDIYSCKYIVGSSDTGLFKAKVSAFKDTAGNSGTAQSYNSTGITVDTTTPSKPTGLDLASDDDTGSSNTDNLTKNTTGLTIAGCAEANSTVELFKGGTAFSTPATDTADGATGCTSLAKQFSISVPLDEQASAYSITAKATDSAGNVSAASVALSITVDTTAPTITATVSGTNDNRIVSAADNDTSTTMKYKIVASSITCNASAMSSSTAYTEGNDLTIAVTHNGKKVCFSSTDSAGNTAYYATGTLSTASALTATVSAVPSGSAQSKDISISSVTSGGAVKYKLITNSSCNATAYGSGGTSLTLTNNAATVTVTNESDNTKYLCFKITKTNFSTLYLGSAQITGIDDTAPTVATPTITTSNGNSSYAKQGDTITVSLDFSEEIDESNTTIKYQIGSGTETSFTYTTGTVTSGKCKETTDNTDVYSCKYTVASGDTGLFKAKVSAFKDTAGNSGTAQSYNGTGITVDTATPSKPTSLDLAAADDTGTSNTDNLTKNTTGLTITGCAEANSEVELFKGGTAFSTPATDTADGATGCTSPAKQFSISVPLDEQASAYSITAKATDSAGNVSAASVALSITVDTTAPTITATVSGTNDSRIVSASDNDAGSTMKYKIITASSSCNASAMSSSIAYTEGNDLTIAVTHNGKKVCFSSTDSAGNIAYSATGILSTAAALTATVSAVPSGSARSKNITISSVTSGASVKYKLITNSSCNATNYGSGGTSLTLTNNAVTVTVTNERDNNKYLCFKLTKANFSDAFAGSAQITGIDDTAPTVATPTITTSNSNTSYAKQGDTVTVSLDFSEEVDEDNTTVKYQIGSGTETSFTYTTGTVTSGKCKETTDSTDVYSCKYTVASGDTGLFKAKVSAFKDIAGNSGTAQTYNATGITVDTTTPSKPTGLDLAATDDTGSSNTDNLTKNTTGLTITGCAEANSTVELFKGGSSFSTPATDTADGATGCTAPAKQFSISVPLDEQASAYSITAKATDSAGNTSAASVALSITVDTTAPTITIIESGTILSRKVRATDNAALSSATSWKYELIDGSGSCNATEMESGSSSYTEGVTKIITGASHNGKQACFSSTDKAGNTAYKVSSVLVIAGAEPTRTWNITDGSTINNNAANITHDFGAVVYSDSSCTIALTNTTAGNLVKLGTSRGSNNISSTVSYAVSTNTITINPDSDLADDTYYVSIADAWYYKNGACNGGSSASISFTVDMTAPVAALSGQPTGIANTTALHVAVAGTGVTHYKHKVVAGTICTSTGYGSEVAVATAITDDISSLSDGSVVLCVVGKDSAENWQTSATPAAWTKDTTAPTIAVTVGGTDSQKVVSALDDDSGTTVMRRAIVESIVVCNADVMSRESLPYVEGESIAIAGGANNGKKVCFSSADAAGNIAYAASAVLAIAGGTTPSSGGGRAYDPGATFAGEYVHFDTANEDAKKEFDIHRHGDSHPEVKQVQEILNRTPCKVAETGPGSPGNETEYFGPRTRDAHLCFQSAVGLNPTGVFDPPTRHALLGIPEGQQDTPAARTVREREQVLQARLVDLLGQLRDQLQNATSEE